MDAWTELLRFPNATSAQLIGGFLKGEGIEVQLFGVHTNNVLPHLADSTVRLMVRETQLHKAKSLLESGAHKGFVSETAEALGTHGDSALEPGDRELRRAAAAAVLGFFFLPVVSFFVAAYFSLRAAQMRPLRSRPYPRRRVALIAIFGLLQVVTAYYLFRIWKP